MPRVRIVSVRTESPGDEAAIGQVTLQAFRQAPHSSHTEHLIVAALRSAGVLAVSLVAVDEQGRIVGHVAVSPVALSDGSTAWFGLGPLSVLPACQGQGVGTSLMQAALHALREQGAAGCVLLGEPAYYGRFGFRASEQLLLEGVPPGYFQALSFGPALPRGTVTYHAAFAAS